MNRSLKRFLPVVISLSIFTALAIAQPVIVRSGGSAGATNVITYTTAPVHLYMDPAGNDAWGCTDAGPCVNAPVAIDQIPKYLRHGATIHLAAGIYDSGFPLFGFVCERTTDGGSGILIDGPPLSTFTPATGASGGLVTDAGQGSGATFGTLVDSTQTWTLNDLAGHFINIYDGGGAGQIAMIVSNDAGVLSVGGNWTTVPSGGAAYVIQDAAAIVQQNAPASVSALGGAGIGAAAFQIANNLTNGCSVAVRNVKVTSTTLARVVGGQANFTRVQAGTPTATNYVGSASATVVLTAVSTTTNAMLTLSQAATGTVSNAYATRAAATNSQALALSTGASATVTGLQTNNMGAVFTITGATAAVTSARCSCGASAAACLAAGANFSSGNFCADVGTIAVARLDVNACAGALQSNCLGSYIGWNSSTGQVTGTCTDCYQANYGGALMLAPNTSVANVVSSNSDIETDNFAVTCAFADILDAGLGANCTNFASGSRIIYP